MRHVPFFRSPSIKVLPSVRPVEQADAHRTQIARFKVPCVDAHVIDLSWLYPLPVHDAAARRAAYKVQCLAAPSVRLRGAWMAEHANIARRVVPPQAA